MLEYKDMSPSLLNELPAVRGRYSENASLGEVSWFRAGGCAEVLYKPADQDDLAQFLQQCPANVPITVLGVLSNTIIRDGGVKGVVIRLGRDFVRIEDRGDHRLYVGSMTLDMNVALKAAEYGIGGLEFLSGIPGSIGGALRMNAGAYGTEMKDVLVEALYLDRSGALICVGANDLDMKYRHATIPDGAVFVGAVLQGHAEKKSVIDGKIAEIKKARAESQPIKSRTGGSTFANPSSENLIEAGLPDDMKVWQLIDKAGCRGMTIGGAQMSEKHCNFMINTGNAKGSELEQLGDEVKRRVFEEFGVMLRWEIKRLGEPS